jgi:vacuolar-type H+-ATPase subunit D/Vma8
MKELSRFELAIVKRTAQNTKSLRTKRDKLVEKIEKAQEELGVINEAIEGFEAPIKTMTGGFTSEEVLAGIMAVAEATEAAPEGEVSEEAVGEVEVPASEAVELAEEVTETPENIGTANPFGEVSDDMPFKD